MTQEKQKVLEMLESGKISAEQAEMLLSALKEDEKCKMPKYDEKMSTFTEKFQDERTTLTKKINAKIQRLNEKIDEFDEEKKQLKIALSNTDSKDEKETLEEEIESLSDEIEELKDEVQELRESLEDLLETLDNLDESNDDLSRDEKKPTINIGKHLKNLKKLAEVGVKISSEVGQRVESSFNEVFQNCGSFNSSDKGVTVKNPEKPTREFLECVMVVKYTRGAFKYKGDFKLSESETLAKTLKPFVSDNAWTQIETLLKEQFFGSFKHFKGNEILKIEVK